MIWAGSENSVCVFVAPMLHDCITCGIPLVFSVKIEAIFLLWAGSKKKIVFYPLRTYLLLFSQAVFPGIRKIAIAWFHHIFVVSIFKEWKMTRPFSEIFLWVCSVLIYKLLEPTCVFCSACRRSTWTWPGFKTWKRKFSPASYSTFELLTVTRVTQASSCECGQRTEMLPAEVNIYMTARC